MHGKWTKEAFNKYDQEHPEIYEMFVKFALQAGAKRERFSAKMIFHRIRWETLVGDAEGDFKIDDGWISHYARKFVQDYPKYNNLFSFRNRLNSYHL